MPQLLEVDDLHVQFNLRDGVLPAVDGVSCSLNEGQTLGIVGESGCGKSVTALSVLRLIPEPPGSVTGAIRFNGVDLLTLSEIEMQQVRGKDISMIFQEPMTSLNPVVTVGRQIAETFVLHEGLSKKDARERAIDMLQLVHIPEAERRVNEYPHQLSGGMRQRVMIAMALACNPKILLADEPTTALDVTIQAQVLELITELREKFGTAVILITHDMGVIAEHAERVIVMYAGKKVEEAAVNELFLAPCHPYTQGLLASIPRLDDNDVEDRAALNEIEGIVPSLASLGPGCAFAPRCSYADTACWSICPPLEEKRSGHWAACWHTERLTGLGE
jgi:peptide/nickel transport system ATP-binding protein|tara:strand:+ start:911 stop:1906 length:996 start_codon:yes stop_codon:yes gene_type:complete